MIERKKYAIIAGLGAALLAGSILSSTVEPFGMLFGETNAVEGSITFEGTATQHGSYYSIMGKTSGGYPLYLISDRATSSGDVIRFGQNSSYKTNFYISEEEDGILDSGAQSVFEFQGATSMELTVGATTGSFKTTYINVKSSADGISYSELPNQFSVGASNNIVDFGGPINFGKFTGYGSMFETRCTKLVIHYSCTPGAQRQKYSVTKLSNLTGGSIVLQSANENYYPGSAVEFTISPEEGYDVETVSAIDHPELSIEVSPKLNFIGQPTGKYTGSFIMPDYNVELSASFSNSAPAPEFEELQTLSLSGNYKTEFTVDDEFDYSDLVVTATYKLKGSVVVDDFTISTPDMSKDGEKIITVSFTDEGKTLSRTYTILVSPKPSESSEDDSGTIQYHIAKKSAGYDLVMDMYLNGDKTGSFIATRSDGGAAKFYFTWSTSDDTTYMVTQDPSRVSEETNTFSSGNWQLYQNVSPKTNTFTVSAAGVLTIKLYKSGMSTSSSHTLNLVS